MVNHRFFNTLLYYQRIGDNDMASVRYWSYTHDESGELVKDLGDFWTFKEAVAASLIELEEIADNGQLRVTCLHIVDNESDSATIWLAGRNGLHDDD